MLDPRTVSRWLEAHTWQLVSRPRERGHEVTVLGAGFDSALDVREIAPLPPLTNHSDISMPLPALRGLRHVNQRQAHVVPQQMDSAPRGHILRRVDDRHLPGVIGGSTGPGSFSTRTYQAGTSVVIALAGEIDLLTEPAALAALNEALAGLPPPESHPRPDRTPPGDAVTLLVMDLTEVTFLSSKGLQLLITADRAAADRGLALRIATGDHHSVLRPLQISGLDVALGTYPGLSEALPSCGQRTTGSPPTR